MINIHIPWCAGRQCLHICAANWVLETRIAWNERIIPHHPPHTSSHSLALQGGMLGSQTPAPGSIQSQAQMKPREQSDQWQADPRGSRPAEGYKLEGVLFQWFSVSRIVAYWRGHTMVCIQIPSRHSSTMKTAKRVVRKYSNISKKEAQEFSSLKALLPRSKEGSTDLATVLAAIQYIQELRGKLGHL